MDIIVNDFNNRQFTILRRKDLRKDGNLYKSFCFEDGKYSLPIIDYCNICIFITVVFYDFVFSFIKFVILYIVILELSLWSESF